MAKVTIKSLADEFSVSKPTVRTLIAELDPEGRHMHREGQTIIVHDDLASLVSDRLSKRPGYVPKPVQDTPPSVFEALVTAQKEAMQAKDDVIRKLETRITQLEAENAELKGTVAERDAELKKKATQLEMSRRLQGFHLPWVRQRIIADYGHLLP